MAQFLDEFRSQLPVTQADQILKLLNKKRDQGQITSWEDFNNQLTSLLQDLSSNSYIPTLKLFLAQDTKITSSEQFNEMLERVGDDLVAGFQEANNIDQIQQAHQAIVKDLTMKNLWSAIADLKNKISVYSFMSNTSHSFSNSVSFSSKNTSNDRSLLFQDPRNPGKVLNNAVIDTTNGIRLTLGSKDIIYDIGVKREEVQVIPQTSKDISLAAYPITKITDGQSGTYWIEEFVYTNNPGSIKISIPLNLGSVKSVNKIKIEQKSKTGIYLDSLYYADSSGIKTQINISETSGTGTLIQSNALTIMLPSSISAKMIWVVLRDDNCLLHSYKTSDQYNNISTWDEVSSARQKEFGV